MLTFLLVAPSLFPRLQSSDPQNRRPDVAPEAASPIHPCFGSPLSGIGDADGDGVPDLLIADTNPKDGGVWLVSLGKKKVLYSVPLLPGDSTFTTQIRPLGDVDGDGRPDWIIGGTWRLPPPELPTRPGNPPLPLDPVKRALLPPPPLHTDLVRSNGALVYSGATGKVLLRFSDEIPDQSLACCVGEIGDFDHEGHADILLGAKRVRCGDREGALAYVRSGKDGATLIAVGDKEPSGRIAEQVAGVGDVDADGTPDIGVVIGGTATAKSSVVIFSGKTGDALRRIPGSITETFNSLQPCGDLDGDGHADLFIGAHGVVQAISGAGMSVLFRITFDQVRAPAETEWSDRFGFAMACLRDRSTVHSNPTLAVSDPNTKLWGGTVYFCSAVDGSVRARFRNDHADVKRTDPEVEVHHLGCDLANLGDVDGDGYEDVACGSENWEGLEDGQAFVVDGLAGKLIYELRCRGDDILFLGPGTSR